MVILLLFFLMVLSIAILNNRNINKNVDIKIQTEQQAIEIQNLKKELASKSTQFDTILKGYHSETRRNIAYEEHIAVLSTIPAVVTSYAPLDPNAVEGMCYSGNPNTTGSGTQTRVGVAASDWTEFPVGTILEIPGYGEAIVEDTGSAMRNYDEGFKIDVVHETRSESFSWGVRNLDIIVKGRI